MLRVLTFPVVLALVTSPGEANDEVERLIGELAKVSEPGFGYSGYFSGSEFLPYENTGEISTAVLGATHRSRSEAMRKIVEQGVEAVPSLLKHIGDKRKIKMKPMSGMMWMDFSDEYDFNRRTRKNIPEGVNRDTFGKEKHPTSHAPTVGDLCFVALGQIVNRSFSAIRYQPTGGLIVSSPSYSKRLRDLIVSDWKDLTRDKHRQLLIRDFKHPDYEERRTGAYLRLSLYYPETVEALVLDELAKPTVDVFKIHEFCRDTLYKTPDKNRRRRLYTQFLQEHGDVYSIGIMDQLFDDLDMLEAHEEGRVSPPLTAYGTQPRELLIQLFDKPANVKSANRPIVVARSESARARLIGTLRHDKSKRIGDVVKQVFLDKIEDDYTAPACLLCLANRGYGDFLVQQLAKINVAESKVNSLHLKYLESISSSKEKVVQNKLREIVATTANDRYFMAALTGLGESDEAMILERAAKILKGLPAETDQGREMLRMIGERFPEKAKGIYKEFLEAASPQRAETLCVVLWYGNPLSKEILAPLLDDKRQLEGFSIPMRVCDRAAQAISHTTKEINFDSEWSREQKDRAITKLKEYCRKPVN